MPYLQDQPISISPQTTWRPTSLIFWGPDHVNVCNYWLYSTQAFASNNYTMFAGEGPGVRWNVSRFCPPPHTHTFSTEGHFVPLFPAIRRYSLDIQKALQKPGTRELQHPVLIRMWSLLSSVASISVPDHTWLWPGTRPFVPKFACLLTSMFRFCSVWQICGDERAAARRPSTTGWHRSATASSATSRLVTPAGSV